jgi:hypothetical protein
MERLVVDLSRFLCGEKLPSTVLCLNQSIALAVHSGWPIDVRAPEPPSGFQLHLTDPPPKRRYARRLTRLHSALDQHGRVKLARSVIAVTHVIAKEIKALYGGRVLAIHPGVQLFSQGAGPVLAQTGAGDQNAHRSDAGRACSN